MKAAVIHKYGEPEVVKIEAVPNPEPKKGELLVKVYATPVSVADSRIRGSRFPKGVGLFARMMFGIFKPRIKVLGGAFSGVVEAVGEGVGKFKVGDEVFGMTGMKFGAHAEYLTVNENKPVILKPEELSHEEASGLVFGGTTALYFLRNKAQVKPGQKVLINGASGAVGTNAVQVAKYYGAEVTAVCSTTNIELVKSLGADHVIDYKKEDLAQYAGKYDLVVEAVGNLRVKEGIKLLNEKGKLALIVAEFVDMLTMNKRVLQGVSPEKAEDLEFLAKLSAEGKLKVIIDKVYPFTEAVSAHAHVDTGHKKGNVILKVAAN